MNAYVTSESEREVLSPGPVPMDTGTDFTSSDGGKVNGLATGPALKPGVGLLAINGNADLSSCVVGNYGGCVYQIYLAKHDGHWGYELWVEARGPEGTGSGSIWLTFGDESGDHYLLRIYSSTRKWHYLRYNSDKPGITTLNWNDEKP